MRSIKKYIMLIWTSQFEILIMIKVILKKVKYETIWLVIFINI
jgi:hypothetical protein